MKQHDRGVSAIALFCILVVTVLAQNASAQVPQQRPTPEQRYESMLIEYNQGKTDPAFLENLASLAMALKHDDIATKIINHFYRDSAEIDKAIDTSGYAEHFVYRIIWNQDVGPVAYPSGKLAATEPDWKALAAVITGKYNARYAEWVILGAKADRSYLQNDWAGFAGFIDEMVAKFPPQPLPGLHGDPWILNINAYNMFLHCSDRSVLQSALKWSEMSIQLDAALAKKGIEVPWRPGELLDTKANLLYKLGNVQEAIALEEQAVELANNDQQTASVRRKAVDLMKNHQPTWTGALP